MKKWIFYINFNRTEPFCENHKDLLRVIRCDLISEIIESLNRSYDFSNHTIYMRIIMVSMITFHYEQNRLKRGTNYVTYIQSKICF